nr:methyl-accepting chemotaxis protein [Bacillus massiliigorillae]
MEVVRAGDSGRGFAVVAEEVCKLSEESSASTSAIFKMVSSIKSGIQDMRWSQYCSEATAIDAENNRGLSFD